MKRILIFFVGVALFTFTVSAGDLIGALLSAGLKLGAEACDSSNRHQSSPPDSRTSIHLPLFGTDDTVVGADLCLCGFGVGDVYGLQAELFKGGATGTVWGVALSPLYSGECDPRNDEGLSPTVNGIQISGLLGQARDMNGLQLAGVGPSARNLRGIGLGGLGVQSKSLYGLQAGFLSIVDKTAYGLELGGLASCACGPVYGLQAGFISMAEEVYGLQVGGFNIVNNGLYGLQIGIMNVCHYGGGLQIGLLNFSNVAKKFDAANFFPIIQFVY